MQRRRQHARRGNALIEFALSFSLLFPLVTGSWDFGFAFLQYNRLCQGLRSGARYASLRSYDSTSATPSTAYLTAVRNVVVYGNVNGTGSTLVNGLTRSHVQVTMSWTAGAPSSVTVSLHGFPLRSLLTTIPLNGPTVTFPYAGNYAPY